MIRFDAKTEQLLAAAIAGVATPDQLADLNALLARDDALLDEYVRLMRTDAALHFQHGQVVAPAPAPAPKPDLSPAKVRIASPFKPALYALAAALLLSAAAVAIYVFAVSRPVSPDPSDSAPIATLIDATGTVIVDNDIANAGREYRASVISNDSGEAEFLLANRVGIRLHGPSGIRLHTSLSASVDHGSATFHCPPHARGYTVHLPTGARVVDLGTRFRVEIEPDGDAVVGVLDGIVEVRRGAQVVRLNAGERALASVDSIHRLETGPRRPVIAALDLTRFETPSLRVVDDTDGDELLHRVPAATVDHALAFDSDGQPSTLESEPIDLGDRFTLLAWVRPTQTNQHMAVLANKGSGQAGNGFAFCINSYRRSGDARPGDGRLRFVGAAGGEGAIAHSTPNVIRFGQWQMIAAAVDRTEGAVRFYVDGVDVTDETSVPAGFNTQAPLSLGSYRPASFPYRGDIAGVVIYRGVLDPIEILQASKMTQAPGVDPASGPDATESDESLPTEEGVSP